MVPVVTLVPLVEKVGLGPLAVRVPVVPREELVVQGHLVDQGTQGLRVELAGQEPQVRNM